MNAVILIFVELLIQRQIVDGKLKIDTSSVIQNNYKLQLLEMLSNGSKLNDIDN